MTCKKRRTNVCSQLPSRAALVLWPCSFWACQELKEQLREPLGLTAETPLALSYQNGSRNSVKKVLEEKQGLAEQGAEKAAKALTHYSWADEGDFVCIYVSAEGEPEAIEAAKDGDVKVQFEARSAELRISKDSKEYALSLRQLEGEIVPDESKHRVSAGKRVTLKMKKKRTVTWTRLQQSK
ncbi:unnamed protein product [Durusdinium trenchii]|uniref:CS domain-containing protein n=1 Tax=Durusdinium trenchii TaxID=1381693 RepID=A0ABP0RU64_9DINO